MRQQMSAYLNEKINAQSAKLCFIMIIGNLFISFCLFNGLNKKSSASIQSHMVTELFGWQNVIACETHTHTRAIIFN